MGHFLWDTIGLKKTFYDIAKANKMPVIYERALFAMCANRLCTPDSKLGVWDRWLDTVYLPSCITGSPDGLRPI